MEEQSEQFRNRFDLLVNQFAALVTANGRHHQPNPCLAEEDYQYSVKGEPINPFVGCGARREIPLVSNNASRWDAGFKLDIPEFKGCLQPEVASVEGYLGFQGGP
jgi:hypothetical protein